LNISVMCNAHLLYEIFYDYGALIYLCVRVCVGGGSEVKCV